MPLEDNPTATETQVQGPFDLNVLEKVDFTVKQPPTTPESIFNTPPVTTPTETPGDKTEAETTDTNSSETTNTPDDLTEGGNPEEIELDDEQFGSILSDATGGAIKSVHQIHEILQENQRLRELAENPVTAFKDPQKKALFEFLDKYQGADYATGIQNYARLQSLDIANMSPKDALKEAYLLDAGKAGVTRDKAEKMFEYEYDEKYASKGDLEEAFVARDSMEARKRLAAEKNEFTATKVDEHEQQNNEALRQARELYESSVSSVFNNDKGEFKTLDFVELSDNPEDDFFFEIPNTKQIEAAMLDYQAWHSSQYISDGKFNAEKMKNHIALAMNYEQISQQLFEHGVRRGKEAAILERNNIPNRNSPPASSISANGVGAIPKTMAEALMAGTVRK